MTGRAQAALVEEAAVPTGHRTVSSWGVRAPPASVYEDIDILDSRVLYFRLI